MPLQSAAFQTPVDPGILDGQVMSMEVLDPTENNEETTLLEVDDPFAVRITWQVTGASTPSLGGSWVVSLYSANLSGVGGMTGLIAEPATIPITGGAGPLTFRHTFTVAPPTSKEGLYELIATINHSPTGDPAQLSEIFGYAQATPLSIRGIVNEANGGQGNGGEQPYAPSGYGPYGPQQDSYAPQEADGSGVPHAGQRYLKGRCPETVLVGEPFSLVASIVLQAGPGSAALKIFDVPGVRQFCR